MFDGNYPFMDVLWTAIVVFAWMIWLWMAIVIFGDIIRRRDSGAFTKVVWTVFIVLVPFLGVLVYMLANGNGEPPGNTVSHDVVVPPVTVTLIATAVASRGTLPASERVRVSLGPRLADGRVSSTRSGDVATNDDGLLSAAEATTTKLPANTTATTVATRMVQRVRRDDDLITSSDPSSGGGRSWPDRTNQPKLTKWSGWSKPLIVLGCTR
jgi:hypothetical protein